MSALRAAVLAAALTITTISQISFAQEKFSEPVKETETFSQVLSKISTLTGPLVFHINLNGVSTLGLWTLLKGKRIFSI